MKRSVAFLIALLSVAPPVRADLGSDVRAILHDPFLAPTRWSIELVQLSGDRPTVLFESHATDPLVPASNLKLVTTSAAMQRLGADFKFRTLLVRHDGDLILVGDGDPSFGDAELLKKSGWDVTTVFQTWARGLAAMKLPSARRLLVDDSIFDDQFLHPHWPADQTQKRYVAEVAGLNLNVNCVDFYVRPSGSGELVRYLTDPPTRYFTIKNSCTTGPDNRIWLWREPDGNELILRGQAADANEIPVSVTVHDPPMYAGVVLAETLQSAGISVGGVERDRTMRDRYQRALAGGESGWTLLAVHQTPLTAVMARANKDSMNLYAECCCKRLGAAVFGEGSWPNGVGAVGGFLQGIGVPAEEYHLDDGCGLSKDNAVSAHLMVSVLAHDFAAPSRQAFLGTMAVAGVDGTMEDRFRGAGEASRGAGEASRGVDLRGRVWAKSGFVNGVSCLSGYLHARDGQWYGFSILFNDVPAGGTSQAKAVEERIVRAVDLDCAPRR